MTANRRRPARTWVRASLLAVGVATACLLVPATARADAVDDAFAGGHAAARAGDWDAAVSSYARAASLLPESSDVLEYDLGTAYAHAGQLGPATFHLRRALRTTGDPMLREAARRNLGVVRRRAELRSQTGDVQISPPPDWQDRLWLALASPGVGAAGIALGWLVVALFAWRSFRRRDGDELGHRETAASARWSLTPALVTSSIAFGVISFAHGLAIRAEPEGIVLSETAQVREGPGRHRDVAFRLQGGSAVRLVGSAPGWKEIRVDGGLTGWIPAGAVGRLDRVETVIHQRSPTARDGAATADEGS